MPCARCRAENRQGRRFCAECGAPLPRACPDCGLVNEPAEKFCGGCGRPLSPSQAPAASRPSRAPASPPRSLTQNVLGSRLALVGERKHVTVLFADLKGSMELLAERDPEEARALLDPVLERLMAAVHRYEGTVNQVLGDDIMALFGAPIAHEDHALRACYAALAMQEAMRQHGADIRRRHGLTVQIRVGLNSGEVVVRAIGNDLHMDYSAIGQTTHLAARMEQLATPGSILLTAETLRLVEGWVQANPLGPVPVKGLAAPVEVFELVGATSGRTRMQAAAERGLTRFVGRQAELQVLDQAMARAGDGAGQVVAVVGEPGVGKSRLLWELTRSPRARGWLVLESAAVSYGATTPYLPVRDLLEAYFQIEAGDDGRRIREKITGKLLALDEALQPALQVCRALLDVAAEDAQWQALDPFQRRQRMLEAIAAVLVRESQAQPLCLVIEDLHWADAETQALLAHLVDSLPNARLLLLVDYRPEFQPAWLGKPCCTPLHLQPLAPASAAALLQALLGDDASLAPLQRRLIEWTAGNPLFLEESVRTLVETGVLAARIDRLPPEAKQVLQCAAVVGTEVPLALLRAIVEGSDDELRRRLAQLQAAGFLSESRLFLELEYAFKHPLTHEVAYSSLLQQQRRRLHAQLVEAIERRDPAPRPEQVEQLAHHAFRGEVWDKAVAYLRRAAARALALLALQHLPPPRDTQADAIDVRFELRTALFHLGEFAQIFAHLREAEQLAQALGDRQRLARVLAFLTANFNVLGEHDRAVEAGQRAVAIATALRQPRLQVEMQFHLGAAYYSRGDYRRAADVLRHNVALLEGGPPAERHDPSLRAVVSRIWLLWALAELGAFAEGIAHGAAGLRLAELLDRPDGLITAYAGVGLLYLRQGDLPRAMPLLERGFERYQRCPIPLLLPFATAAMGAAYTQAGRLAEAVPLLEQAVAQGASPRLVDFQAQRIACLGEAYLGADRLDEATAAATHALELSRAHGERGWEAYALRLLGDVEARRAPPRATPAETCHRQALALAEALDMRPLLAHCHLGLGQLYLGRGQPAPAHAELSAAVQLYCAMAMPLWRARAEAELVRAGGAV